MTRRRGVLGVLVTALVGGAILVGAAKLAPPGLGASPGPTASAAPDVAVELPPAGRYDDDAWGFGFDHPASWRFLPNKFIAMSRFTVAGYVTSQPLDVKALCGEVANGSRCSFGDFGLEQGNVALMLSYWGSPGDNVERFTHPKTGEPIKIGGVLATLERRQVNVDTVHITWMIARPMERSDWIQIDAEVRGPGLDALAAQVATAVESLRWDEPLPVLQAIDGPRIAAIVLARLRAEDARAFGCFPPPGEARMMSVSALPHNSRLKGTVEATCRSTITPTPIGLWRLELRMTWTPTESNPKGGYQMTQWVKPDGESAGSSG